MNWSAFLKAPSVFLIGVILGVASVLLHNAFLPLGLVVSLVGTGVGVRLVGRMYGGRRYKLIASFGWLAIVLRASIAGVGGELLVEGNFAGNALIVGGFAALSIATFASH